MRRALLLLLAVTALGACGSDSPQGEASHQERESEGGIVFREGKGLEVSSATRAVLPISVTQVTEGQLESSVRGTGHVYRFGDPASVVAVSARPVESIGQVSLLVSARDAAHIKPGSPATVGNTGEGTVKEVRPPRSGLSSDSEVLIEFTDRRESYRVGRPVDITLHASETGTATLIPKKALLETVNGTFVYVPNGQYYFRTAVTVGRKTDESVEVLDGLYPGDEVVTEPVTTLWLAELQALRGGVACADGH